MNLHFHENLKCDIGETTFSVSVTDTAICPLHTSPTSDMKCIAFNSVFFASWHNFQFVMAEMQTTLDAEAILIHSPKEKGSEPAKSSDTVTAMS
jgi:hypothetical protein